MADKCPDCKRLMGEWAEPSDDDACYAKTGYDQDKLDCAQLTTDVLRSRIAKLEAVVAAAGEMAEFQRGYDFLEGRAKASLDAYDAAKAELERVKE